MKIGGLQRTTLIDFPGRVACTVFTVGCNFRCPFCHNRDLITLALFQKAGLKSIPVKEFFLFLASRKKILDGVCISGGEPTLQPDLPQFCQKIKDLGLEVKLDTNGSNPEMLKRLIKNKLVDFVAMDIKTNFENYSKLVKRKTQNAKLLKKIKKSIRIILNSNLEYEFRTTVVPGIHDKGTMGKLAKDLRNLALAISFELSAISYMLQPFRPQNCLDPNFLEVKPFTDKEMKDILKAVKKILPATRLRGVN